MAEMVLSPRQLRQGIRDLLWSVAICCIFDASISGAVLSGLWVALKLTPEQIGTLVAIGLITNPMQLIGSYLQMRFFHRKHFWVLFCALYYGSYFFLALLAWQWTRFSFTAAVGIYFLLYAVTCIVGNAFNAVLLSWYGDVIPPSEANFFWNRRTGIALIGTMICGIIAGCIIDFLGRTVLSTYSIVISIGVAAAMFSLWLRARVPDPAPRRPCDLKLFELFGEVLRNRDFRVLTLFFAFQSVCNWMMAGFNLVYLQKTMNFSQTLIQILLGVSGIVSFLSGYLFTVWGNRYGKKPLIVICSALKALEFVFWGIMLPSNNFFDCKMLALVQEFGISAALIPAGFFTALPAFLLGGIVNMGLTSGQLAMLTSIGKKEQMGFMIGFFGTFVGFAGAIASAGSGYLYRILENSPLPGMMSLTPFNLLCLIGGAGYFISCFIILSYRESGAAPTVKVVRSLLGHNPFRTIYLAMVLKTPVDEKRRAEVLLQADGELNDDELVRALLSPSSVVRESALVKLSGVSHLEKSQEKALLEQLRIPGTAMRSAAAKLLGSKGSPEALPAVAEGVDSPDAEFACACIYALGWSGNKEYLPRLRELLKSDLPGDPRRSAAADAAGRIGSYLEADGIFHAYELEEDPISSRQCLAALCRVFSHDSSKVLKMFESEEQIPGSAVEKVAAEGFGSYFNVFMTAFEKGEYATALEAPLRGILAEAGIEPPENLAHLLVAGKFRSYTLDSPTRRAAALRCLLKLWSYLFYEGSNPDRFELLAALFIALSAKGEGPISKS